MVLTQQLGWDTAERFSSIAILRNARVCNSAYEYTQHVPIAKAVGLSDEQIAAIDNW
jgi:hypothetical protein